MLGRLPRLDPLEEVAGLDLERPGEGEQPPSAEPVLAGLVLVHLLIDAADPLGQLLLGQAERDPPRPQHRADVPVNVLRTWPAPPGSRRWYRVPRHRVFLAFR